MPTATDLVTDLPADFAVFGQGVDTSMAYLLGGTTGQILSKTSGTNMAFTWINNDQGDITAVTTGTDSGLSGGATSGAVALKLSLTLNAQIASYTLVLGDLNKLVTMSNASGITLTVPPSLFSAGDQINIQSIGVGLTTFAAGAGVTITSTGAAPTAPILRARYSAATVICTASNVFTIIGDLS